MRSFNKWKCAFNIFIFLIFLINEKTSLRLSYVSQLKPLRQYYAQKVFIKFKVIIKGHRNYLNRMSHINFDFLSNNFKGIQSSKKRLKQFEYFKIKLKPSGLLFLQETHSTIDCEKSGRTNLEVICTFLIVYLILANF